MQKVYAAVGTFAVCAAGGAVLAAVVTQSILPVVFTGVGIVVLFAWVFGGTQSLWGRGDGKGGGGPAAKEHRKGGGPGRGGPGRSHAGKGK